MVVDDACEVQCGLDMMRSRSRQGARKISFKRLKRRAWRLSSAIYLEDIFLRLHENLSCMLSASCGLISSQNLPGRPSIYPG